MKKWTLLLLAAAVIIFLLSTKKGKVVKNVALSYVLPVSYVNDDGLTVSSRTILPEGFERESYRIGTFQKYIQDYNLKNAEAKVVNYDGSLYGYQSGHIGVLDIPVPSNGLQQCADALIRIRAEYLWSQNRKDEIGFNFTSGHYCSWKKYSEGYRPKINGSKVSFHKTAAVNSSKENFYKYLNLIYTYSGTLSLFNELPQISDANAIEVGDMLIYPGSPGHVIMVVDKAIDQNGKKLFIFAQGNTPAQSVHMLKNPNNPVMSPWYEIEIGAYLEIPTYYFNEVKFMRFK